ncbi:MAG TPA: hypothetical protein VFK88_03355 [Gallionella sp.]|nr:hypothetical protein [Gallionella sp.]
MEFFDFAPLFCAETFPLFVCDKTHRLLAGEMSIHITIAEINWTMNTTTNVLTVKAPESPNIEPTAIEGTSSPRAIIPIYGELWASA